MVSATDTPRRDPVEDDLKAMPTAPRARAGRGRRRRMAFPLTARILAINMMALGVLVAGFFYLDQLQRDLMDDRLDALAREATLLAAALGESAVETTSLSEAGLDPTGAATLIYRLNLPVDTRALLFNADGTLAVDSWRLPMAPVQTTELPPPEEGRGVFGRAADAAYDWITARLPPRTTVPLYIEPLNPEAADFPKVLSALQGTAGAPCTERKTPGWSPSCPRRSSRSAACRAPCCWWRMRTTCWKVCATPASPSSRRLHRARYHHPPQPLLRRHDHPARAPAGAGGRAGARRRRTQGGNPRLHVAQRRDRAALRCAARHDRGALGAHGRDRTFRRRRGA